MSNARIYLLYHDAYRDTGDFGGDIQRAMDEVSSMLDETGVRVTKSGKVFAESDPNPSVKDPEDVIYADYEVKVYPTGVSGEDKPEPINHIVRKVPVKRIPKVTLLPSERPSSDKPFDRALASAKASITQFQYKEQNSCPFTGTLAMLWHSTKSHAKRRKADISEDQLNDTLRMIQKAIPEASQPNYQLYKHFASRIIDSVNINNALDQLQRDFTLAATEMHKLTSFNNAREIQLETAAFAMGVNPAELVSCDLEGNVIGGRGAWLTDQGRWTEDTDNTESDELYADYHTAQEMDKALEQQVVRDAFNRINTGAGSPDYKLVFDPKNVIRKPVGREFWTDVPSYTVYVWPKNQDPTEDNLKRIDIVGFWGDVKRNIYQKFPEDRYQIDVERGDKVTISTHQPVHRRPTWYLTCPDPQCDYRKYYFDGHGGDEMTELARLAATPDEWIGADEREMREWKAEAAEMVGMPLIDFMNFHAERETCCKCTNKLIYVNPVRKFKIKGDPVVVPEMTICRDYGWWEKPLVMDNWNTLLSMYGGDKEKAAERMDTISTPTGIKYAEQEGDTTYTWNLDWLQQESQFDVRRLRGLLPKQDLTELNNFDRIRKNIPNLFTKKQARFLTSCLYSERARQYWEQIEDSNFVNALRRKLATVNFKNFHEIYSIIAQILYNDNLSQAERNYGWALLNALKSELQTDAERSILTKNCKIYSQWIDGLKLISFRHLNTITQRCATIDARPEAIFLIREEVRSTRKRLSALARNSAWIREQENYLHDIESGDAHLDQARFDDIIAASKLAQSASHLANKAKELADVQVI